MQQHGYISKTLHSVKKSLKKGPKETNQKPGVQPGPTEPNLEQLGRSALSDL